MKIPAYSEAKAIAAAVEKRIAEVAPAAARYEKDLISFTLEHTSIVLQIIVVAVVPIAALAFMIGRHFH